VLHQQPLRDHPVEHLPAHHGRIEQRCVEVPAQHGAQAVLLLPEGLGELLLADLLAAHFGDLVRAAHDALIRVDAPEREGQRDHRQHDLHQALVLVD
jgi:hypothetical protein